ncbi:MAG TPA: DUF983 domain-containing protein [Dongiaceae bacterium]|jgi:uncharacterized protein (DUF983 family)|nr:DUF983 domain-containing protein [Dongiaceae bacterium]
MAGYRSPIASGLACRCPRCGQGKLFVGLLKPAERCSNCGLDFHADETGDGPVAFVILIWGAIVMGFAFWAEFAFDPPYWLFVLILIPISLGGAALLMRPAKGVLMALQLHHRAGQGNG